MKTKIVFLLTIGVLSLAAQAAEKTMHILRSATTTNDTWVAAIGGLDEGDTLVFDTSDFTAVGGGSAVNFGNVVTPPLAGLKFTGTSMGVNLARRTSRVSSARAKASCSLSRPAAARCCGRWKAAQR